MFAAIQQALHVDLACRSHMTAMLLDKDDGSDTSAQQCSKAVLCMQAANNKSAALVQSCTAYLR